MKEIVLNGISLTARDEVHRLFAAELEFPEWYGNTLDSLYDCLTDLRYDVVIHICDIESLESALGSYARRLMGVLRDASSENPRIKLVIE